MNLTGKPMTLEEADREAEKRGVKCRPSEKQNEIDERGAFIRQPDYFDTPFGDKEGELKAASGKYRLFWSPGCQWSNRVAIVRELLGLENAISINTISVADQAFKYGYGFTHEPDNEDPVLKIKFLSEVYYNADPDYAYRATIPALVDIETKKVVNNDSHRLTNYLETAFRPWQAEDAPDLYPEHLRKEIDHFNDWLFPNVNDGYYRMRFCQSLEAYKEAFDDLYNGLDRLEERLENNRFLFGDYVTDSDVRLYVTLVRADTVYYKTVGPIKKRIVDYKNIWAYIRDLYEIPAFKNNTHFKEFATVFGKDNMTFSGRFADVIDYDRIWSAPQNRKILSRTPEEKFLRHSTSD